MNRLWFVGKMSSELPIGIKNEKTGHIEEIKIDLCWAYGMIGVCPIFETEEAARKHANGAPVYPLEFNKKI